MAYCQTCGTAYEGKANYCPTCGVALGGAAPEAAGASAPMLAGAESITPRIRTTVPRFVRDALHPAEPVLAAFSASLFDHRQGNALVGHDKFVLTPERIIVYHTGLIHKGMGEIPYGKITGVSYDRGLIHGKVIVDAANAGLTMDGIGNGDAAFAEKIIAGGMGGRRFVATGPVTYPSAWRGFATALAIAVAFILVGATMLVFALPLLH